MPARETKRGSRMPELRCRRDSSLRRSTAGSSYQLLSMKSVWTISLLVVLVVGTGCVSKKQSQLMQREAYVAGQQQAMAQAQQQQNGNDIVVSGEVQNRVVTWREGLTLAEAILAADYRGHRDPISILIIRKGQVIPVEPKLLLRGHDEPLEPGDHIELRR